MKIKLFFISLVISLTPALAAVCGCSSDKTYTGEMHYTQYGTEYGIKVEVTVKDEIIQKVEVVKSDYVSASPQSSGWDSTPWDNGLSSLLKAYEGKTVQEILSKEVATEGGIPLVSTDSGFINYGSDLIITGATLGSGRLLLAVQNALS